MAGDRFGFLERHGFVRSLSDSVSKVPTTVSAAASKQNASHRVASAKQARLPVSRLLVALPPVPDLLFFAKYLFGAAIVAIAPAVGSQR
jgi:hypothetical protein